MKSVRCLVVVAALALMVTTGCASAPTVAGPDDKAAAQQQPPVPPPKGLLAGRLIRKDTKAPVGEEYLSLQSEDNYFSAYTDGYGRFRVEAMPAGSYTVRFYNEGYKQNELGPIRVGKDEEVTGVELGVDPVDPQVTPYTYQDVYRPNENVEVMVRSIRVTELDLDFYRVPDTFVRQSLSQAIDRRTLDVSSLTSVLSYRQPVAGGGSLSWRTTPVKPAFDKPGVYVIRVRGGSSDVLMPLLVTNLSLITKRGPSGTLVYASDIESSEPIANALIVPEGRADLTNVSSGMDGLTTLAALTDSRNVRLWGFAGPNVAYVDTVAPPKVATAAHRAYIITDRPIYRTGHEVFYKVVARADEGGSYRVRPGERWTVTLRDALGRDVMEQTGVTNPFGTFSGRFEVGEDAPLGDWTILVSSGDVQAAQSFEVQEYRKPDFELQVRTDAAHVVQGEAVRMTVQGRYYFGAVLAGAEVYYTVYETAWYPWRDESWGDESAAAVYGDEERYGATYGYGRALTSGTLKLDEEGKGTIDVGVPPASYDRRVTVEVSATDASDREVSARQSIVVSSGSFGLAVNADGFIFKAGEEIPIAVVAKQFDASPVATRVKITAAIESYNDKYKLWVYKPVDTRTIETGSAGTQRYGIKVDKPGVLRLDAVATDQFGNSITDTRYLWVTTASGVGGWQKKKSMEIVVDKASYKPGDTARVLVNSQIEDATMLFTIEDAKGVRDARVVKLSGNSRFFEIPITDADAPTLYLGATFAIDKAFYTTSRAIAISPESRMLGLTIGSDKETYAPNEEATITVRAVDQAGAPVAAEVALAVVDEAIYALASDNITPIGAYFYGPRSSAVTTSYSFPSRYLGGASKDGAMEVRTNFKDTAYWNGHVVTDADGQATVKVKMPENLTSWRIVARAVTGDEGGKPMRVGQGTATVVTAKDLIARVLPPRFATTGDSFELTGQVHNLGEAASAVKVWLEVEGSAELTGTAESTLTLASGEQGVVRWPVRVSGPGAATLRIFARSDSHSDAMELKIPTFPVSVPRTSSVSGLARQSTTATFVVPEGSVAQTAKLSLELSPSLAGLAFESLEALATFPYGCVEQTMSAFLPDIVVQLALTDMGRKNERLEAKLPVMIAKGAARLARLQHDDGGWGWWEHDGAHPFMTAYVVYGLLLAERAGFDMDDGMVDNGLGALRGIVEAEAPGPTKAYGLFALSLSVDDAETVRTGISAMSQDISQLDSWGIAVLALAAAEVGLDVEGERLALLLEGRAQRGSGAAWFDGSSYHYGWNQNRFETTGMALRALVAAKPDSELVQPLVEWLVRHRRGGMWDTTRDTAVAIHALSDVLRSTGEATATYDAEIEVDGSTVATLKVTPDNALSLRQSVTLDASALPAGEHTISIAMKGEGVLYWSGALRYGAVPEPRNEGFAVTRRYQRIVRSMNDQGVPVESMVDLTEGGVDVGDELLVTLTVETETPREMLIVEDPLAAGFEVRPGSVGADDDGWSFWYSHFEVRDEKVAFFATRVPKGKSDMTYRVRVENAGAITASPAVAWQMYLPDVMGNSAPSELRVAPKAR